MTVLGLARTGVALARFLPMRRPRHRVRRPDGRRAGPCDRAARGPLRDPAPGPGVTRPATWAERRPRRPVAVGHARYPTTDRASGLRQALAAAARRQRPPRPSSPRSTCSCGSARPHGRGDRHQGQDDDLLAGRRDPRGGSVTRSWAGTSVPRWSRPAGADPGHRVVTSCPNCSCRPSRGARRRGLHQRHLRPPRPARSRGGLSAVKRASPSSWIPPAPWSSASMTWSTELRRPGARPGGTCRDYRPLPAASRVPGGWIVAAAVERLPLAGGGAAPAGSGGGIMPLAELAIRDATTSNALAAIGSACCSASPRRRSAGRRRRSRESAPAPDGRPRGQRPVRERLPGDPAGRRDRGAPRLPGAGRPDRRGRDKGIDLSGLAPCRRGRRPRRRS